VIKADFVNIEEFDEGNLQFMNYKRLNGAKVNRDIDV